MSTSRRLDEELAKRGLVPSRAKAKAAVAGSAVMVDGVVARKASQPVSSASVIVVDAAANAYVSRAALKLIHALDHFGIDPAGRHAIDIGASTGGFTQVLLERGAAHVTAIDVGHGQMAQSLADDQRVTLIEGLNARDLKDLPDKVSLIVCDVSFISLKLALPPVLSLAPKGTILIALIKPQFEVGRGNLGKGGIVRDESLPEKTCTDISMFLQKQNWTVQGITPSPITGGDGNKEFLIAACKA